MVCAETTSTTASRSKKADPVGAAMRRFGTHARDTLALVWLPLVLARVITLSALALAHFEIDKFHIKDAKAVSTVHGGLLAFDASWYLSIAAHGYHHTSRAGLRFFPLYPALARLVHVTTRIPYGGALVIVANVCALGATMLVAFVTSMELHDRDTARRAAWLFSLVPAAFSYVMGYAEPTFILLAASTFVCLRRRWWTAAAALGLLAGLARPIGFALVVPAAIEAARAWRDSSTRSRAACTAAVVAPVAGLLAYLSWVGIVFSDFFAPVRYQREGLPQSMSTNPLTNVGHDVSGLVTGKHLGSGLHLPWIALALVLCIVACRRLPASYGAYAIAVFVLALGSANFESFERYAFSAFPLVIAAAALMRSRRVETTALLLSAVALFAYAFLAFQGAYVP